MKQKLHLWLAIAAAVALCIIFVSVFITYAQPMDDDVYNLSPIIEISEVDVADTCEELGWTVYTQEGENVTVLTYDGFGCFEGLEYLGQTFYFSRVMQEELDAPTIQLSTANRNFSVFLDGVLIYTDCPEQDNRIGYLTLPMREFDRKEDVTVSLPEDYVGKTITIAQSTPLYAETPRMMTRVKPASMKLYCSYAYESELIAESFQTAFTSAVSYALGMLLLLVFLRHFSLGRCDWGLLFLALAVFFSMTAYMYDTSYSLKYFGIPDLISTSRLCQYAAMGALLFFLSTRAQKLRFLPWLCTGAFVLFTLAFCFFGRNYIGESSLIGHLLWWTQDYLGGILLMLMLVYSFFCRREHAFHRFYAPLTLLVVSLFFVIQVLLPSREEYFSTLLNAIRSFPLHNTSFQLGTCMAVAAIAIVLMQAVRQEINLHTEKQLVLEMSKLSQQRYENLHKHNEEVMALRHDMNRHFTVLRQMTTDEKTALYLDELISQNKKIRPVIQSGNEMIDIILSSRLNIASDAGLQVEVVRAKAPEKLPMSDADLCSLTMNLIDNAIEAARKSGANPGILKLDLHVTNNFFVFICENSSAVVALPAENEETVPKHGLGLKIVRQIAERYDALLQAEYTEKLYKVSLALPLAQPSK